MFVVAISSLVSRSVTEDKYGIVQQDMGEVIALLLNLNEVSAVIDIIIHC